MSRNLTRRNCARCEGDVRIVGPIADITREQARAYFDEYQGMKVADADCATCRARYLAWCAAPPSWPRWEWYTPSEGGFFDLSYRSTFNDEPGPEDLPPRCPGLCAQCKEMKRLAIEEGKIGFMLCETCAACPVCRPPAPASGYPAPWTWDALANSLRDANDNLVLWVAEYGSDMQLGHELVIAAESDRTRALVTAAPEMLALLREFVKDEDDEDSYAIRKDADKARAILARIDAAAEPRQPR